MVTLQEIPADFSVLPEQIQWEILNKTPFIDIFNYCQVNRFASTICASPAYFQHRFLSKGGDINIYMGSPFSDPIQRYVSSLVVNNLFGHDPTILTYLTNSDIVFPGPRSLQQNLWYFIGPVKMAQRAILQNDKESLLDVLRYYPGYPDLYQIIGALYLKYMDTVSHEQHFFIDDGLMSTLIRNMPRRSADMVPYYPSNPQNYAKYRQGTRGEDVPINTNLDIPYIFGLIDGKHSHLFLKKYQEVTGFDSIGRPLVPIFDVSMIEEIVHSGTIDMVIAIVGYLDSPRKRVLLMYAIKYNNLAVVKFMMTNYHGLVPNVPGYISPPTQEMADLLSSFGVEVYREDILGGALRSGNYGLWVSTLRAKPGMIHGLGELKETFSTVPPYMLQIYIRRARVGSGFYDDLVRIYVQHQDFPRLETLLGTMSDSMPNQVNLTNVRAHLAQNPMVIAFGWDTSLYPNINRLLSKQR